MKKITTELAQEIITCLSTPETLAAIEATEKASSDTGTFEVVISSENVDRYGEVIKLDAWELEHYLKSPVVLWGHDHKTLPIGMATSVVAKDGKLIATGKFAPHEHAQQIRTLYDLGMLRATSVGFIEKEREGNLITKAELIEFSFVSVPANPFALALALDNQRSVDELVTKGFIFVEKEAVVETPAPVVEEEKNFGIKEIKDAMGEVMSPLVAELKTLVAALEAITKGDEPEGAEEGEVVEETDEQKGLRVFSENRKKLQDIATLVGDVLAETRTTIQAR